MRMLDLVKREVTTTDFHNQGSFHADIIDMHGNIKSSGLQRGYRPVRAIMQLVCVCLVSVCDN